MAKLEVRGSAIRPFSKFLKFEYALSFNLCTQGFTLLIAALLASASAAPYDLDDGERKQNKSQNLPLTSVVPAFHFHCRASLVGGRF